ncbi:MAG TPA: hypothetical protein VJV78_33825 [Polyangiales bacterium]|nr:hypothetical protein [Polyangiales bacterium]
MPESILVRIGGCLGCVFLLAHCEHEGPKASCVDANNCGAILGGGGSSGMPGSSATAGVPAVTAGTAATAGAMASAGTRAVTAGSTSQAGSMAAAGATSSAGMTASAAGASGSIAPAAGTAGSAGASGGGSGMSGSMASAGMSATAGMPAADGGADQGGVALAKPGDSKTGSRQYLNLGDFRLLVNKWGSDELNCNTTMKVFANADKSIGWSFDRGGCGGNKQKPDYPEIEFGIHPFGAGSNLATTPSFTSTKVLPLQIKDIMSASVTVDGLNVSIQKATTWNVNFEFWLSEKNPVTEANPGVYAEVIAFWGWQDSWPCDQNASVTAGDKSYGLCHQDDHWGSGWRYYQFRANGGPFNTYSGKIDVKAFLDWVVNTRGFSKDLWVTRLEVGTELDDNTGGTVNLKNITFQVNGASKSPQFAQ